METEDFDWQLKQEQEERWKRDNGYIYTDPNDGTVYEWDTEKQAWFPRVDENFIAAYQASYGVTPTEPQEGSTTNQAGDESTGSATATAGTSSNREGAQKSHDQKEEAAAASAETEPKPQLLYRYQKMQMKRKPEQGWFDVDESKNTNVYVSGLPDDITLEEFKELMSKYGIIMVNEETEEPKIKLYMDDQGHPKGDGRCCYLKRESVDLAIQLLDESEVRGHRIHVEVAKFTLKGDYKPSLKKKKKPNKKKKGNIQAKLLDWRPEKKFQQRKRNEQVVIIKHLFDPSEFEEDAMLINEIKDDLQSECSRFGEVKKVMIFDNHPEGVASVKFRDAECADSCIQVMNGRWFAKRQLEALAWDGKTDYKVEETDKEREARLKKWEDFLQDDEEEDAKKNGKEEKNQEETEESREKEEEEEDRKDEGSEKVESTS